MQFVLILIAFLLSSAILYYGIVQVGGLKKQYMIFAQIVALLIYVAIVSSGYYHFLVVDLLILLVAVVFGNLIASFVNGKSALIVFCVTAGLVDIYSYFNGLTHAIVSNFGEGKDPLLLYLGVAFPLESQPVFVAGIADWLIIAGIFYGLTGLGYSRSFSFLVPWSGLLLAVIIGLLAGGIFAIPFISFITIIAVMYSKQPSQA